jgi:hypothetical protein
MGLRLLRRDPAPAGRHSRAVPGPLVPGAAATLVAAAEVWDQPVATAYAEDPLEATAPLTAIPAIPAIPVAPVLLEVPTAPAVPVAPPAAQPPVEAPAAAPASAPVSLGFADGARIDLEADDPRVRTFRAAAAALLEAPRA